MENLTDTKTLPLTITDNAYEELLKIKASLHIEDEQGLRVGVKGGGCAGMSYLLAFDTIEEKDEVYTYRDLKVFMSKANTMYLVGMEIDYEHGLNSRGFTFNNPNAANTCGCGTSFSAS